MENYRKFIKHLSNSQSPKEFLNSDEDHALVIFEQLFSQAKKDIRIFAGSLCCDSDKNYHVANDSQYISALSEFVERGGKVKIILNDFNPVAAVKSNLMRRLLYYKVEFHDRIEIKTTTTKLSYKEDVEQKSIHFTVIDNNAYRIETNIEQRSATGSFNNEEVAVGLIRIFDDIYQNKSQNLDIVKLFSN
ncbi:MAG: hypothetical protein LBR52_04950 [Prevotellaceae bacterium]|jgi:phosphatidylserine/phosphatidylglycerophosphate/cardiolipin synthase-like enzyme|nr:hypothetical protein [Prevotellaceae bacterium]